MIRYLRLVACILIAWPTASVAAPLPGWARDAAAADTRRYGAAAVVLLDHVEITVTHDGRMRSVRRYAVRVHDRSARQAAVLREVYLTGSGRVQGLRGWLMPSGGPARELDARHVLDVALVNNDVYNEVRVRALTATDSVADGDVFAAEVESEDRLPFAQLEWQLQSSWPTRAAARLLRLPPGWRASSTIFNGPAVDPIRQGDAVVWRFDELPALPDEEGMPPATAQGVRLAVSFFGSAEASGQFATWKDVSRWLHALSDTSAHPSPQVATRARELTANARTNFERAALIGRYVQRVQYVSIQTGLGRGGGYQPRPPAVVFERNYGDCKDKASLMRAMLAAIGIESHLVSIFSGDRQYVREEWPSPQQFNHAIVAVALPSSTEAATSVLQHEQLGRLVVFDPTDEHTAFGELALPQQASLALIITAAGTNLVRMPLAPPAHHTIARVPEGTLSEDGRLAAQLQEQFTGARAAEARARYGSLAPEPLRALTQRHVRGLVPRAIVRAARAQDVGAAEFKVATELSADGFGQLQGRLLLVTPPFDGAASPHLAGVAERKTPLLLEPQQANETARVELPAGFRVDEMPAAVSLDGPFGRYRIEYAVAGNVLTVTRSLETPLQTIRPEQYADARAFFEKIRATDTAPIVLARTQ